MITKVEVCGYPSIEGLCGRPRSSPVHSNPAQQAITPEKHPYVPGVWVAEQLELFDTEPLRAPII